MNKYHNRKTECKGQYFDSVKECERWLALDWDERHGIISDLRRQVRYELIPSQKTESGTLRSVNYIADFVYTIGGKTVVEDVKGVRTAVYQIKKKLMYERYGILIHET